MPSILIGEVQAMNRVVCSLLALSAFVGPKLPNLAGQTTSTEVSGIVSDSSGLPVPKAEVVLTRIDTGEGRHELTNQQGIYVFRLIEPSTYRLEVRAPGFKATTVNNLDVLFQQR